MEPFIGQIMLCPYSFAPRGWADCGGQLLPIQQYSALFSLLGTNFGGNGTTNFALPNLSGRVLVGAGNLAGGSSYQLGEPGGSEMAQLPVNEMAGHSHTLTATPADGTVVTPGGNVLANAVQGSARAGAQGDFYSAVAPDVTLNPLAVAPAGGGQPHNNVQPSLVLRYCIALQGVFPSRP